MDLQNRENFLNKLAQRMGKARQNVPDPMPVLENNHAITRLTDLVQPQLCQEFIDFARVMMADVIETKEADVAQSIIEICEKYGGTSVIINNDQRLKDLGITEAIQAKYEDSYVWDFNQSETNFEKAKNANIGVVYGEYGLAESGVL